MSKSNADLLGYYSRQSQTYCLSPTIVHITLRHDVFYPVDDKTALFSCACQSTSEIGQRVRLIGHSHRADQLSVALSMVGLFVCTRNKS